MHNKTKRLNYIYILYWVLLAYILAALVWWFIALNRQNHAMAELKLHEQNAVVKEILNAEQRKTYQYAGEGAIFFLLIAAGAVFVFRAIRRQLRQSQQQQNFMMAITHELKTPIAVTRLNLETMQKRKLDETQQQRLLQNTLQEASRLNDLCNNLLLSSQMEAGGYIPSMDEIDFTSLVNNCTAEFVRRFPGRHIKINAEENVFVMGDTLLLQMAVNNLIDNALKYSPKEATVEVLLDKERNKTLLSVKDGGSGIPEEERPKVFTKFYRMGNASTKTAKGTGLGLYLVKKIMQQHNADISVTENKPTGSIFTISIPLSDN